MLLVMKSRAACLSAVESYNRASAMYREETFSILMINAWELLLKARIMRENGGKDSALHEFRPRRKKDGTISKFREVKRTRSGTPMTIGIDRACNLVAGYSKDRIDNACVANIEALLEIRDCATHFVVTNTLLRKTLTEISLAAVRNYVVAVKSWFDVSFSDLNIASIPITFDLDQKEVDAVAKKAPGTVVKFLKHILKIEALHSNEVGQYAVTVRVDFDLIKKKDDLAVKVMVVPADADLKISLEGDTVRPGYDWTYEELIERLKARYDFKQNAAFHTRMKAVKADAKLHYERFLDPVKKKGTRKSYFNTNVLKEFDIHYTKKGHTV